MTVISPYILYVCCKGHEFNLWLFKIYHYLFIYFIIKYELNNIRMHI